MQIGSTPRSVASIRVDAIVGLIFGNYVTIRRVVRLMMRRFCDRVSDAKIANPVGDVIGQQVQRDWVCQRQTRTVANPYDGKPVHNAP